MFLSLFGGGLYGQKSRTAGSHLGLYRVSRAQLLDAKEPAE
jgi:hypothetical protein